MNKIIISGYVCKDPETTFAKTGNKNTKFTVSVRDTKKGLDGEYQTYYFHVNTWGASADFAEKYIKKGMFVLVTGKLVQDRYVDRITGKQQYFFHIEADSVENGGKDNNKFERSDEAKSQPIGNGLLDYVDHNDPDSMYT